MTAYIETLNLLGQILATFECTTEQKRMETLLHKRKENKWRKNPSSALPTLTRCIFALFFFRKSLWMWEKYQKSRQSQSRNSDSAKTPLVK